MAATPAPLPVSSHGAPSRVPAGRAPLPTLALLIGSLLSSLSRQTALPSSSLFSELGEARRSCPSRLVERASASKVTPHVLRIYPRIHAVPLQSENPPGALLFLESAPWKLPHSRIILEMDFLSSPAVSFFQADQAMLYCKPRAFGATGELPAPVQGGREASAPSEGCPTSRLPRESTGMTSSASLLPADLPPHHPPPHQPTSP